MGILNNDQASCKNLGLLSSLNPVIGGAAGAFSAKIWNSFLEKSLGVPKARSLLADLRAVAIAVDKVNKMELKNEKDFRSAIAKEKDPVLVKVIQEKLDEINQIQGSYKRSHNAVLKKYFGSSYDVVQGDYNLNRAKYNELNPRQKLIIDLMKAGGDGGEGRLNSSAVVSNLQKKIDERKFVDPKKNAITGGVIGAFAGFAIDIGINAMDKQNLDSCAKELGLSNNDLTVLKGRFYLFSPTKAKSSTGLFNFKCDKLGIQNSDETLAQVKLMNNDRISPGVCQIMVNEMSELDSIFETMTSVSEIDCSGFKADNFEMKGS